ncbi:MAG: S41 family peptidase [Polyangiaceae bacterium]
MLPASNNGPGMSIGFPDVCLTPIGPVPVPIPYPNFAIHAMASVFSIKVRVACFNALNLGSLIPVTFGMQPGVLHPLYMDFGAFVMGSPKIFIEALPAIHLLCPTIGNAGNNAVGAVLVPGAPNVFYTLQAAPDSAPPDLQAIAPSGPVSLSTTRGGAGMIRIHVLSLDVPALVLREVRSFEADGLSELVLDLRDCPGGELRAALELAGDFLPRGSELARVEDGDGDTTVFRSTQDTPYTMPLTVIVNRGTASAAEVLAGCLKAHGRARILGERTYGKGTGQALSPGAAGPRMQTGLLVRLPGNIEIEGCGVQPDETWGGGHA